LELVNEAAQWSVMLFLVIFVVGLTRQLGHFLVASSPREKVEAEGPTTGSVVAESLLTDLERRRMTDLREARQADWMAIVALSEDCTGCQELLAVWEEQPARGTGPLAVICRRATGAFQRRLERAADVVVVDEKRFDRALIGITPFTMILDEEFRVVEKEIGGHFEALAKRRLQADAPPELEVIAVGDRNRSRGATV